MSFIKVTDPRKREELIRDFIETRKRIKDNFIARKVGEAEYQTGLTKLFKPVTETQKATTKEITDAQKATAEKFTQELLPIKEGIEELPTKEDIKNLPLQVFNQIYPALKYKESDITKLGGIAVNALIEAFTKDGIDRINGVYAKDKRFYMGNKKITIEDNDITIIEGDESGNDIKFKGSSGLWKLITEKSIPDKTEFTPNELIDYIYMMHLTKTTYIGNDPLKAKKGGSNKKLNELIKPFVKLIEDNKKEELAKKIHSYFNKDKDNPQPGPSGTDPQPGPSGTDPQTEIPGGGLKILPSDPNALIDRFDLLFSSKKAGHTGVRNEIISILDELKRQKVINVNEYKKLNSIIKK